MHMQDSNSDLLSSRDYTMLTRALTIASVGSERHKHGAVLYKSGRVLGVGVNVHRNSHPTMDIPFPAYTTHAEINAMRSANYNVEGATLYIARFSPSTLGFVYSRPCAACRQALVSNGIKRVVYSV